MKKLLIFSIVMLLSLGAGGIYALQWIGEWAETSVELEGPVSVEFPRGTKLAQLTDTLHEQGVISSKLFFTIWIRFLEKTYPKFQAGVYRFEGAVNPKQVSEKMVAGDIYVPVVAQVSIPEGFTVGKIIDRLVANGVSTKSNLQKLTSDKEFIRSLKVPSDSLEGFLYPATYRYTDKLPTGEQAIREMVETFWSKLPENYEAKVNERGLSLQSAVTFASLIELETLHEDEKPYVSEVIWRRLKTNQPLGIDAAIIYGIPNFNGDLTWKNLKDNKNPYNLRLHKGFPPTPIGNPSVNSLQAVLTPSQKGYNYYVLEAGPEGRHHFSVTLDEHNSYVRKYLKYLKTAGTAGAAAENGSESNEQRRQK